MLQEVDSEHIGLLATLLTSICEVISSRFLPAADHWRISSVV